MIQEFGCLHSSKIWKHTQTKTKKQKQKHKGKWRAGELAQWLKRLSKQAWGPEPNARANRTAGVCHLRVPMVRWKMAQENRGPMSLAYAVVNKRPHVSVGSDNPHPSCHTPRLSLARYHTHIDWKAKQKGVSYKLVAMHLSSERDPSIYGAWGSKENTGSL